MRLTATAAACLFALASCTRDEPPQSHDAVAVPPEKAKPAQVTVLLTGSENGYLLPAVEEGALRGGAAEVLGRWRANERHCASDADPKTCGTLVLSTGDNFNGQAISSYFRGESTAEVMKLMGYAGSALGNRELDWAHEQFAANVQKAGFGYLAANLRTVGEPGARLGLKASELVYRGEVKVGVVGLAAHKALRTPMPGRMAGLELVDDEVALEAAVQAVRADGAHVVVVLTDGCLTDVAEILKKHADWQVTLVSGRKCEEPFPETVGTTKLVYPGSRFTSYARARITLDVSKKGAEAVQTVDVASVDVVSGEGAPPPDAQVKAVIDGWSARLTEALGQDIGHSAAGVEQESAQMAHWLSAALKERFKADVGLVNRKGVRQGLPRGVITRASIWDLVPFENEIVVVKMTGEALVEALTNVAARYSGARPKGDGFVDAKGAAIDPKKTYTVATTDYLYLGGDGFGFQAADPAPTQTKVSIQSALIDWTAAKKSSARKPLESMLK